MMKPFKKSHFIFVLLIILSVSFTGCSPKTIETESSKEIKYDAVYVEELPIDIQLQIDSLIIQRGYYKWTTMDAINYLLIASGEKPTGD